MSNSFQLHGLQHTRFLCPSLSPRVSSNSCPLSLWYYLTISFSVAPFCFCLQSFISSSHQVAKGLGVSASSSVLPMNIQSWFPLGLTGLISLLSRGLSRVFSSITVLKHQFFSAQPSLWSSLPGVLQFTGSQWVGHNWVTEQQLISIHDYWKNHSLDCMDLCLQSNVSVI